MQKSQGRLNDLEYHCHQDDYCACRLVSKEVEQHACHRPYHEYEVEPVAKSEEVFPWSFVVAAPAAIELQIVIVHERMRKMFFKELCE